MESVGFEYSGVGVPDEQISSRLGLSCRTVPIKQKLLVYFRTYDAKGQILVKSIPSIKKQNYFQRKI